jgi:hypothetical protein
VAESATVVPLGGAGASSVIVPVTLCDTAMPAEELNDIAMAGVLTVTGTEAAW